MNKSIAASCLLLAYSSPFAPIILRVILILMRKERTINEERKNKSENISEKEITNKREAKS